MFNDVLLGILQNEHFRNANNMVRIRADPKGRVQPKRSQDKAHGMWSKTSARSLAVHAGHGHMHAYMSSIPSRLTRRHPPSAYTPASDELVANFNSARAVGSEMLTSYLRERVIGKNTSLHAYVLLIKRLTFVRGHARRGDSS